MVKTHPQSYPRRTNSYIANDALFPAARQLSFNTLSKAIESAFERSLKTKTGESVLPALTPEQLVEKCITHLQERSDPILSPSFLSQCSLEEVFEMDAIAHEMQRHRMKIGNFYQFLVIELMKTRFNQVYDGKREGDVEAEIDTPTFDRGLRLYISVKKSADTVGGQDIGGVIARLESLAKSDKNLTRPYMVVVAIATPPRGLTDNYENSRLMRFKKDGSPYSPNCEEWYPGFIYPFVCGRDANTVYKEALKQVGKYFPFNTITHKTECAKLLADKLRKMGLVNSKTGQIDPWKFQEFCHRVSIDEKLNNDNDD